MAQGILSGCLQEVNRPRSPIPAPFRMEKRGEYLAKRETGLQGKEIAGIDLI
jgi:hypothetical protein